MQGVIVLQPTKVDERITQAFFLVGDTAKSITTPSAFPMRSALRELLILDVEVTI